MPQPKTALHVESGQTILNSLFSILGSLSHHRPELVPIHQHPLFIAALADAADNHLHRLVARVRQLISDH
jgi:hypothetical protein